MRVTPEHWQVFLEIAEQNPELISCKFNGVQGKAEGTAMWHTVAEKLNGLGYGQKTVTKWRKTVTDWKSKVKVKAFKLRTGACQIGGPLLISLTPVEKRLLSLMGTKCLEKDYEVPELGLPEASEDYKSPSHSVSSAVAEAEEVTSLNDEKDILASVSSALAEDVTSLNHENNPLADHQYASQNLQETSGESVTILRNINTNIARIADSLEELLNVLKHRNS